MNESAVSFLSVKETLELHAYVTERYGGHPDVRDYGLLASAVMMPQQQFGGEYLHPDLAAMGAAYLFHLAKNHAFLEGNNRVALAATLAFLVANGVNQLPPEDIAADITIGVAASHIGKDKLTHWLRTQING